MTPFFVSPRTTDYSFGERHPLKPERLRRTLTLLERLGGPPVQDPGPGRVEDALRVHAPDYVEAIRMVDEEDLDEETRKEICVQYGLYGDNPPFAGMYETSLAYNTATAKAAEAVADGAPLAIAIGGGLHHAHYDRASGFCIYDDPAVACAVLREVHERVAYVDIDVHHGDGVQGLFYDDPSVLTCSIHEEGRTLFPGTGYPDETGAEFSSFNVPVQAKTTADVWLDAFSRTIPKALERFRPGAIVLQLGADTHYEDPLGHVRGTFQSYIEAVRIVRDLGLPIVAVGGGGYNLTTVPRLWTAAILELCRIEYPDDLPTDLAAAWGIPHFADRDLPFAPGGGREFAERIVATLDREVLPNIGAP